MSRSVVLGVVVAAGVLSAAAAAWQGQPQGPRVVEVEKLKDNLYMLKGGGGNTAVFVTSGGVVVVDTKNPGWGQPILDKIKEITDKPVTTIVNTHTHGDHVSGNVEFPATVDIVVQDNTKANMEKMAAPPGMQQGPNVFQQNPGKGMPKRTFKDKLTLGSGADRIDLYYFGPAHTGGDAFVAFPAHRVMHVGDTFPSKGLPIMDKNNGGSGVEYANTIRKAVKGVPDIDTIINGHTPANTTPADMSEFADFVADFVAHVQAGKKAGKSAEQVAKEWTTPAKYTGFAAAPPIARVTAYVNVIFGETK